MIAWGHIMILDIVLFPVSLVIYAFLLHYFSKKTVKLQHALLAATAGTIVWGVLFGILNLLFAGAILYYVGALAGLLYSVLYSKTRTELIASVRSFPTVAFLFGCVFFIVLFSIKEPFYVSWDEFSHWGPFVKNAKLSDALHIFSEKEFVHPPYYQGTTVLYYIGSFFSREYAEADVFAVYCVFFVACAVSLLPDLKWKNSPVLCAAFLLATPMMFMILPYANYAAPYTSIYLDSLVGVFFGAVLSYIITSRHENTSVWTMAITSLLLLAFFQIKDIAVAFCMICMATYAVQLLINRKPGKQWKLLIVAFLLIVVVPLVGRQLWSTVLTMTGNDSGQFTGISVSELVEIIRSDRAGENTWFTDVFNAFLSGLGTVEVVWSKISIPLVALIIFVCGTAFGVFAWKKERDFTYLIHALLFVLYFACYLALLLVIYLCAMSPDEAMRNASMDRYMATFLSGFCIVLLSWAITFFEQYGKSFAVCVPVCLILAAAVLFPQSLYVHCTKELTGRKVYEEEIATVMETLPEGSSVWLVQYGENPGEVLEKYIFKYLLLPNGTRYEMPMNVETYTYEQMIDYARSMSTEYIAVIRDTTAFWNSYGEYVDEQDVCVRGDGCIIIKVAQAANS